ncbi:MAG: sensor domain-containing diguanylate cyclase [Acidimicrobiales bacterium]
MPSPLELALLHAMFAVAYGLAFGSSVSRVVLPGTLDSTPVWVWLAWHTLFPLSVTAALWPRRPDPVRRTVAPQATPIPVVVAGAAGVLGVVAAVTAVIVVVDPHLPELVHGVHYSDAAHAVEAGVLVVNLVAAGLALAWSRHVGTVERWAALAVTASVFDVLFAVLSDRRYTVGWYLSRTGDIVVASVVLVALIHEVGRIYRRLLVQNDHLAELATHDPLTAMLTRRALVEAVDRVHDGSTIHVSAARRMTDAVDPPLAYSVAMVDLDHFKAVNDRHGHLVGDQVLTEAAARARRALRTGDSIGRYGGEEFLILLPRCDLGQAVEVAERVRSGIGSAPFTTTAGAIELTASIGVAYAQPGRTSVDVIDRADRALYRAKATGRDRCVAATPGGGPAGDVVERTLR